MALNVTLPQYVEDNRNELIRKAVMIGGTFKEFNLQTGVKTEAQLDILNTDVKFGDGMQCGWAEAGTSSITARKIKAGVVKVNMSFCDKKLLNTSLQHQVRVAAGNKVLPFEQDFIESVLEGIKTNIDALTWQGDTASTDVNLKVTDGLLKIVKAEAKSIKVTSTGKAGKVLVDEIFAAIPSEILNKAVIYLSPADFRQYIADLQAANLYHISAGNAFTDMSILYPGSSVKVKATPGMPTGKAVAADPANVFHGTDLSGDEEKFDFWYSKDNQEFRLAVEFSAGFQVAIPSEVVIAS